MFKILGFIFLSIVLFFGLSSFMWTFIEMFYFPMRSVFPGYLEVFNYRVHIIFLFPYFVSLFVLGGFLFLKFYSKQKKVSFKFKIFIYLFLLTTALFCSTRIYNSINEACKDDPFPSKSMCGTWIGWI